MKNSIWISFKKKQRLLTENIKKIPVLICKEVKKIEERSTETIAKVELYLLHPVPSVNF
jgi:hypothetical protein